MIFVLGIDESLPYLPGFFRLSGLGMQMTLFLFVTVVFIALFCEYMDASIGMGYGTTLTPLLLIIGFLPLQVVPAVLLGQLVGGMVGGIFHHRLGNINLDFRQDQVIKKRLRGLGYIPRSFDSKVVFVLAICGILGASEEMYRFRDEIARRFVEVFVEGDVDNLLFCYIILTS